MKYLIGMFAAVLAVMAGVPAAAQVRSAQVATDLNMRAGPGTHYRIVTTIPGGADVGIFGCTAGHAWCDVGFAGIRGWVYARYLLSHNYGRSGPVVVRGPHYAVPVVTFKFYEYSSRHYRPKPKYYGSHRSYRPPPRVAYPRYKHTPPRYKHTPPRYKHHAIKKKPAAKKPPVRKAKNRGKPQKRHWGKESNRH